ncbi:MAG: competence protein ComEC [Solirubrobacteraceae bacterium]|jgi:competence protein ComEC|nr:competence protein ComEC [Solirubrobacteraceae bacterium]
MSAVRARAAVVAAREVAARHPRHVLLAGLVAGLLAGPRSPAALLGALVIVAALAPRAALALGAAAAVLAGAAIADARLAANDRTALRPLIGAELAVRATLLEQPRLRAFGTRVAAARLLSGPGRGERVVLRTPLRVRWPADPAPGIELRVRGALARLGPFDAAEHRRGAHAVLRVASLAATGGRRGGILGALDAVRARTERALTSGVPPPQGALARGMVLGQDAALTEDTRQDFRATGLSHLVAASGANVALLATLALAAGAALGLGLTGRLLLTIGLIAAYVPLAGGGASIQRAGVMGAAALVAALAGRPASRWYALLLAAAVTLALNPRAAEDPGWQLSFAAVVALLVLVPSLTARLRRAGLPRGLADATALTAAATIGTAPLIALHFERLSLVSLPANVLAAPAVAAVMWLGTIAGALGQLAPGLAAPVASVMAMALGYLTWLADRGAAFPYAQLAVPAPAPLTVVLLYVAGGLALLAWRRRSAAPRPGRRRGAVAVLAAVAVALLLAAAHSAGPPHDLTVSFLDIGQGDATLVQHGGATVLVDTGPPAGRLLAQLRRSGVRRIDVLVLTHNQADHVGAAPEALGAMPVGLILDGEEAGAVALAARYRVRRLASDAGQVIHVGPIELSVLWPHRRPAAAPGTDPNDRATVLHVRDGDFDLLLTADAESPVTMALDLPAVEAIKVAHHGSDDPGLPGFLARVRPHVAVISVGAHNSYGHPTPATLAALRAVPIVRRTDRDGTVRISVRGGRMAVGSDR